MSKKEVGVSYGGARPYIYPREIENILEKEKIREEERNDDVTIP